MGYATKANIQIKRLALNIYSMIQPMHALEILHEVKYGADDCFSGVFQDGERNCGNK